ncbi:MAG: O-antigen ligase family protein [Patescibacteria group bacterium]
MTLEKMLRGTVLAGVFFIPFIPLIVSNSLFFPFITGKNFTFRIVVEVLGALWLALALVNPIYRPRRSWLLASIAIFVFVVGIADLFGANPAKSIWSNYERMEGWVTLAHLLVYTAVLIGMLNTADLWRRFWHTSVGVSFLAAVYGMLQLSGFLVINQGGIRLDATFGNATYMGIYMFFHMFVAALLFSEEWKDGGVRLNQWYTKWHVYGAAAVGQLFVISLALPHPLFQVSPARKEWTVLLILSIALWLFAWARTSSRWSAHVMLGMAMLLQATALFFTATRGAIIGALGGIMLSAILLVLLAHQSKNAWRASIAVVLGVLLLVGGFLAIKDTAFVRSVEPLSRLASISLTETTVKSRFLNYQMAIQGVRERPLLGWGQENYNLVFNKYFDPQMYAQEPWFDRVHNVVFDWLVAAGVIGFVAYASIFFLALWGLWRSGVFSIAERSILTGLFAGYLFHNLFVFDNITSYMVFFALLAYMVVRMNEAGSRPYLMESLQVSRGALAAITAGVLIVLGLVVWTVNGKALVANKVLLESLRQLSTGKIQEGVVLVERALSYHTFGSQEIREHLAQNATNILVAPQVPEEIKKTIFAVAVREMEVQIAAAPQDARFPLIAGIIFGAAGQHEQAAPHLEKAHTLSPAKQGISFQLVANRVTRGDLAGALALAKETFEAAPAFDEARVMYATLAILAGDNTLADELLVPLVGATPNPRVINAFVAQRQFSKIGDLWEARMKAEPTDLQARVARAAAYYADGKKAKSIEVLEQAARDIPQASADLSVLIKQVREGKVNLSN